MTDSTSTIFSWRGLLQSLFEAEDDATALGSVASPIATVRSPRWTRESRNSSASAASPTSSSGETGATNAALPYSPSRLDGEFNVWFARKPLGLGLVPSTQLYGTWEVSSIASAPTTAAVDEAHERRKIRRGDVILAVNYNTRSAQLPREEFTAFLAKSTCPIVVTLRRPAVYGSLDSRALSTAMFPASTEYRGHGHSGALKTFHARASSMQWKHSSQHELLATKPGKQKTRSKAQRQQQQQDFNSILEPTPETDPVATSSSSSSSSPHDTVGDDVKAGRPRTQSSAQLSEMGEYTHVFHELPLHLVLAPSTRLYGSVEVYDPKVYEPVIQIGDVILAVNGDSAVSKWPTNDAIDYIETLTAPVSITFRRPQAYRKYLHKYFKTAHATVSSHSTATAMFPNSAEYKHGHHYQNAKSKLRTLKKPATYNGTKPSTRDNQAQFTDKEEWQRISSELAASDQFKPWQSHSSTVNANTKANAFGMQAAHSASSSAAASWLTTSAFLTERHVHFLWDHLPEYLTCNDMELAYDTRRHGWNLLSFYALVEDKGPTLLVIKDTRDQIFGAFSSTSWKQSSDVYGNGRCFVFTLRPQMKIYEWSGLDHTFMYGQRDALMMGGGKKGMALCVQLDELRGFSHACETFDSPPLAPSSAGDSGAFEIENMEVWCFSGLRV